MSMYPPWKATVHSYTRLYATKYNSRSFHATLPNTNDNFCLEKKKKTKKVPLRSVNMRHL